MRLLHRPARPRRPAADGRPPHGYGHRSRRAPKPSSDTPIPWATLLPVRERPALTRELLEQRRGLPVHRSLLVPVATDPVIDGSQTDRLGEEHGAAAVAREAITGRPDHVNVAR